MMNSRVRRTPARGAGLVALLDLEVVEDQRQVAVGADRRRDVEGDDLLVGHRQHQVRAAAVLELEQLLDLVAPGPRHGSAGCSTGISISWPPIASISSRTIWTTRWCTRQPAGSHVHSPAPDLPDQAGAHHQLVRDRLGVGGRLALGRQEVRRTGGSSTARSLRRRG